MGLLDDLNDETNFKVVRSWCSTCTMLAELSDKEREAIQLRLDDKNITHASLSAVLKKHGYNISGDTLGRHRRGMCSGVARK